MPAAKIQYEVKELLLDIPRLAAEIYYCSEVKESKDKSNQGGLQIHDMWDVVRPSDELTVFREKIKEMFLHEYGKPNVDVQVWLNINPPGTYNELHSHETPIGENYASADYSGVYYVSVPEDSGQLVFKDSENVERLTPLDHMLVLFPSNIWHGVNPNNSQYDRISIAFNVSYK